MKRLLSRLLPALAAIAIAGSAQAQFTDSAAMTVTARVNAKCTINAQTMIDFLAYDPVDVNAAADLAGTGTVTVQCNKGSSFYITFAAVGGTMTGVPSGDTLPYTLWEDAAHLDAVRLDGNDDPTSALRRSGVLSKAPIALPIYGLIPMDQDVGVGVYTGTIQATVNY